MRKHLFIKVVSGSVLVAAIALGGLFISIGQAANTHSMDFERGTSQYLSVADSAAFSITGDMTIEFWVKPESMPVDMDIISKWNANGVNQRSFIARLESDGDILFANSSDGATGGSVGTATVAAGISSGSWQHVAVVYSASTGWIQVYKNGVSQGTVSGAKTNTYDSTATLQIGASDEGVFRTNYYDGLIDDVRIWNVARTGAEIEANKSVELAGSETGLVGYWRFNNDLNDASGNGNTLVNNNSAVFSSDAAFAGSIAPVPLLKVRKGADESVIDSTVLQNDDDLKLTLAADTSYIIDGVVFVSSPKANPDFVMALSAPAGATTMIGFTNAENEGVLSGAASTRITLRGNTPTPVHLKGTIKTGSAGGDMQLEWAQAMSSPNAVTVQEGSYLRADAIE